jgi:hypothetical protein
MQIEQKLITVEEAKRRWHTRLARASNEVDKREKRKGRPRVDHWRRKMMRAAKEVIKLEKQRRRYHAMLTGSPKAK